jgi:hypothetical protein
MELMVDAFNGGELTALQDAEEVLGRLMGYQVIPRHRCEMDAQWHVDWCCKLPVVTVLLT